MWKVLCVLFWMYLRVISGKLVGDHICRTEESYAVNVTESYIRNVTVRNYKWCLNVPPRCSYYTIKKINDTRIVEKNETRTIEKCCLGYFEIDHHCVPCENCKNGFCTEGICQCVSGFRGTICDTRCYAGFWGPNCTNICKCSSESCSPIDGECTVNIEGKNKSYDTNLYQLSSEHSLDNYFTENTQTTETLYENDNLGTEWYQENFTTTGKQDILNYDGSMFSKSIVTVNTDIYTTAATGHITNIENNSDSVEKITNSVEETKPSVKQIPNVKNKVISNEELIIPVGIQYDRISKSLLQEDTTSFTKLEEGDNHLDEPSKTENENFPSKESYFINSMTVSAATTTVLICLALVVFTVRKKYKTVKQKVENNKSVGVCGEAIYTTSIFHTPLPDPPACQNPSYLLPLECQNHINEPHVETHIRSNSLIKDCNFEYDYPPSSGSYRAGSIIEPLVIDMNQRPICAQMEPVYDEIPCRGEYDSIAGKISCEDQSSVYMNTCGVTTV